MKEVTDFLPIESAVVSNTSFGQKTGWSSDEVQPNEFPLQVPLATHDASAA